ncbi:hypothetical protein EDB80DRAFT_744073 [Ilyonectria destructans]|nr:hypothetical protein EDB80DRAFT_744073 [Ilyonectria destructans]
MDDELPLDLILNLLVFEPDFNHIFISSATMLVPKFFLRALSLTSLLPGLLASASRHTPPSAELVDDYPLTVIHEFPNPTWLENIAVRQSGQLLVTSLTHPRLYQVDPSGAYPPVLVADIAGADGLLGIAELERDVFYVIAGNLTATAATASTTAGTFQSKIWKVDIRRFCVTKNGRVSRPARVSLVADLPDTQFLNGMCRLSPTNNSILLLSDSVAGSVIRLNVKTGTYSTVIQDPTMSLPAGAAVAINGIHIHGSDLYYTNLAAGTFVKMPISLVDGKQVGSAAVIFNDTRGDDFILSKNGRTAWITTNSENTLLQVDIQSRTGRVVAGSLNSTDLAVSTAVAFGRTRTDSNSLYVVTTGGIEAAVGGLGITGGRVIRIDLL